MCCINTFDLFFSPLYRHFITLFLQLSSIFDDFFYVVNVKTVALKARKYSADVMQFNQCNWLHLKIL